MKISLTEYGPLISDKKVGDVIYEKINNALKKEHIVDVDFRSIISMATFCAKQIFGKLYIELGSNDFFDRIKFHNTNEDLKIIIKMGIHNAIEENN